MSDQCIPLLRLPLLTLSAVILGLCTFGCSDRERVQEPEQTREDWSYGESRVYQVPEESGARIADTGTGKTFEMPDGGGRLTITPILGGSEVEAEDEAFEIEYTGTGPVELALVQTPDDHDVIQRHMPFDYVIQEGEVYEDSGWVPIATIESAPDTVRIVLLEADDLKSREMPVAVTRISKFKRVRVKMKPWYVSTYTLFRSNINLALGELMLAVADHRRFDVQNAIADKLAFNLDVRWRYFAGSKASNCYAPFMNPDRQKTVYCGIMLIDDSGGSIAHETGHYFHHVLVGTEVFKGFRGLPAGHELGRAGAKFNLIEDMAYFTEYYLKGLIGDPAYANPEKGTFLTSGGARPATGDFTDLEGFGVAMLASLTRSSARIQDFEGRNVAVPVVNGEVLIRFQAGYEIIASGINTVPSLREKIENYLFINGSQQDKLPAMLEPIGWSYHADCVFVDDEGEGVPGVTARSICKVGGTTYTLPKGSGTSGSDGKYRLDRVFPGNPEIRAYVDNDSIDIPVDIGWTKWTHEAIPLPGLVVKQGLLQLMQQKPAFAWWAEQGNLTDPTGPVPYTGTFSATNMSPPGSGVAPDISWTGQEFTCRYEFSSSNEWGQTIAYDYDFTAVVSPTTDKILELEVVIHDSFVQSGTSDQYLYTIKLENIPRVGYPGDDAGNTRFHFRLNANEVAGHVTLAHYKRLYNGFVYESRDFESADQDWNLYVGEYESR